MASYWKENKQSLVFGATMQPSFQLPDPVQQDCDAERGRKAEDDFEANEHREDEQLAYKEAAMPSFSLCDKKATMPMPNRINNVTKMPRKYMNTLTRHLLTPRDENQNWRNKCGCRWSGDVIEAYTLILANLIDAKCFKIYQSAKDLF